MLIVGGNETNIGVIETTARAWMMEPVVCSSLNDLRAAIAAEGLVLIFSEEILPEGQYGDVLLMVARSGRRGPVVVVISDENRDRVHREAMELGAFEVIAHPCSKQDVQWVVIRAMNSPRLPRPPHRM